MERDYDYVLESRQDVDRLMSRLSDSIADELTHAYYSSQLTQLESRWAHYDSEWRKFSAKYHRADGHRDRLTLHTALFDRYQDLLLQVSRLLKNLNTPSAGVNTAPPPQIAPSEHVKLPEIKLRSFFGDPLDFGQFWNQFESLVGSRTDLDNVTKYTYLTQCLKGSAQDVLEGFKGESSDYAGAVDQLQSLYGDEKRNQRILLQNFLKLKEPNFTRDSLFQFKVKVENLLKKMGRDPVINVDGAERVLLEVIYIKLPEEAVDFLFNLYKNLYFSLDEVKSGLKELVGFLDRKEKKRSNNKDSTAPRVKSEGSSSNCGSATAVGTYSTAASPQYPCIFCNNNHRAADCTRYTSVSQRKSRLSQIGRCPRCVRKHGAECTTVLSVCRTCNKGNHHSYLCFKSNSNSNNSSNSAHSRPGQSFAKTQGNCEKPTVEAATSSTQLKGDPAASTQVCSILECNNYNYSVALATATVTVRSDSGQSSVVRSFFDNGSQRSFIHKDLANKLGLKNLTNLTMRLDTFMGDGQEGIYEVVRPVVSLGNRKKRIAMAVVDRMPRIVTPGLRDTVNKLTNMGYNLADKHIDSDVVENVQIMIGSDFFSRYLSGMTSVDNIDLYESPGGLLIYGILPHNKCRAPVACAQALVCRVTTHNSEITSSGTDPYTVSGGIVDETLPVHKLWDLDFVGISHIEEPPEDLRSKTHFESTVKYDDGRYWVELPFKDNCPFLPTNFRLALGQMNNQVKKFRTQPELLTCYNNIIKDHLKSDFIEVVNNPQVTPQTHYLPHHAVAKQSSTTPLRIVYNCSAKLSKTAASLNDCLLTGPSLTDKLISCLIKFRTQKFAYIADIEKAFLQVGLQEHHRDFTRFLWPDDPFDDASPIKTYRFTSVLFGATCSPFLLQMTLQYHLSNSQNRYAKLLSNSFYVDNLQGSFECSSKLIDIFDAASAELGKAGMTLSQWNSNSSELRSHIKCLNPKVEFPQINNVLGLNWDTSTDTMSLKSCKFQKSPFITKRQLLSLVSTCFDPLGFCTPILIKGKILIQSAWKEQVGWDTHLPPSYLKEWEGLAQEIEQLSSFKFPRGVCASHKQYTLHTFVDASSKAFGAVSYLSNGDKSHFVTSKARVAPLKTKTLPQLELTSMQLGTQLSTHLISTLDQFKIYRTIIWSDSEVALQWVRNNNSKLVYVRNRVANIREMGSRFQFLHVSSGQNPADLLTRGIPLSKFRTSPNWVAGPDWLLYPDRWPAQKSSIVVSEIVSEVIPELPALDPIFDCTRCSSLTKLLAITKHVFRFICMCRPQTHLPEPGIYWMQQVQKTYYPSVYRNLKDPSDPLDKDGKQFVRDLGLYLEESSGLVRSRGRLHHSTLNQGTKFPILIPTKCHFAKLLILFAHEKCLHGGVPDTLAMIRQQYWMPKCRQTVKSILSHCVVCKRVQGGRFGYPGPPPLPQERVQLTRPFAQIGVDYSGPITLTRTESGVPHKYYIVVFTCTATRLVHLELASDMSTASFINLFRRFCATYSFPELVISDNGRYFVASAKFFDEMLKYPEVDRYMKHHNIVWKFIAPRAPWMGGFYERMIGLVKSCLKKVLFKKRINRDELATVLSEIQCRLNNRPLTYLDEEGPLVPLTPSHLLTGRTINNLPSLVMEDQPDPIFHDHNILNAKFSHLSNIINHFEKMWRSDYLTSLREKHYGAAGANQERVPKVGEVVIVERQGPQHEWPLGRIVALHPDSENLVRIVDVSCEGVITKRTIDKLVPLEIYSVGNDDTENVEDGQSTEPNAISDEVRPIRQAAQRATRFRRELIERELL